MALYKGLMNSVAIDDLDSLTVNGDVDFSNVRLIGFPVDDATLEVAVPEGILRVKDTGVVTDKIADNAVTNSKIADGAVDTAKLAYGAVTTDKIADGNVTNGKIDTVSSRKLIDEWQVVTTGGPYFAYADCDVVPVMDNTYDLGRIANRWRNVEVAGTLSANNLAATTGSITTATCTSLTATSATCTSLTATNATCTSLTTTDFVTTNINAPPFPGILYINCDIDTTYGLISCGTLHTSNPTGVTCGTGSISGGSVTCGTVDTTLIRNTGSLAPITVQRGFDFGTNTITSGLITCSSINATSTTTNTFTGRVDTSRGFRGDTLDNTGTTALSIISAAGNISLTTQTAGKSMFFTTNGISNQLELNSAYVTVRKDLNCGTNPVLCGALTAASLSSTGAISGSSLTLTAATASANLLTFTGKDRVNNNNSGGVAIVNRYNDGTSNKVIAFQNSDALIDTNASAILFTPGYLNTAYLGAAATGSDSTYKPFNIYGSSISLYHGGLAATNSMLTTTSTGCVIGGNPTAPTAAPVLNLYTAVAGKPQLTLTGIKNVTSGISTEGMGFMHGYHDSANCHMLLVNPTDTVATSGATLRFGLARGATVNGRVGGSCFIDTLKGRNGSDLTEANRPWMEVTHPFIVTATLLGAPIMQTTTAGNLQFGTSKVFDMNASEIRNAVIKTKVTSVTTTPYAVLATDYMLAVNTSSAKTLTLPQISTLSQGIGTTFIIKDVTGTANTYPITINRSSTDLIDGQTSFGINQSLAAITLICTAAGVWSVI